MFRTMSSVASSFDGSPSAPAPMPTTRSRRTPSSLIPPCSHAGRLPGHGRTGSPAGDLPERGEEAVDVLVGGADADRGAHRADRAVPAPAGGGRSGEPGRDEVPHERVGAEPAVADADAVTGGELLGDLAGGAAGDDEGDDADPRVVGLPQAELVHPV